MPNDEQDQGILAKIDHMRQEGRTMSNFDHVIPAAMESALRDGAEGSHPGWDHWGRVWFAEGLFHEDVMQYGHIVKRVSAESLRELMRQVNDEFGYE